MSHLLFLPSPFFLILMSLIPREDADLNQDQFDWLGTVFYLSYLVFEVRLLPFSATLNLSPL